MQLATSSPSFQVFGCVKAREIRWTLTAIALPKRFAQIFTQREHLSWEWKLHFGCDRNISINAIN